MRRKWLFGLLFLFGSASAKCNWIDADLLYWIPREDAVVLTNHKTDLFEFNDVTLQPTLSTHFPWDFGSRIGFGHFFSRSQWDVAIHWTRFTTDTRKKSNTRNLISEGMFLIWSLADDIIRYDWVANAKMHWTLGLNLLDLDLGCTLCSGRFPFRP